MLTRDALAEMLTGISVAEVARRSKISEKTIYRLRGRKFSPRLDTIEALVAAVDEIKAEGIPEPKAA